MNWRQPDPEDTEELKQIEERAFRMWHPPGALYDVNSPEELAFARGHMRQCEMLREYARRKAAGEFPDGPEVRIAI